MNLYSTKLEVSSERRAAYAEEAVRDAFRGRDLSLAREPNFVDRRPDHKPRPLGEIIENVTDCTARRAIRYWQKEATLVLTETERQEALLIAGKIAKAAGLDWPEAA